jgi:hypothetical protein
MAFGAPIVAAAPGAVNDYGPDPCVASQSGQQDPRSSARISMWGVTGSVRQAA